jgi:hypothetical protein
MKLQTNLVLGGKIVDHSYEEIRNVAIDILAERELSNERLIQYVDLMNGISEVIRRRETGDTKYPIDGSRSQLSLNDQELFLEIFWDLFRQGIITLGFDRSNKEFPFFRVSALGKRILAHQQAYFFHDVTSYNKVIIENIPDIDEVTLLYLNEAMQAFLSGCVLSSSVMLGVAAEHSFELLIEDIEQNEAHKGTYNTVFKQKNILPKLNEFKKILDLHKGELSSEIKEDLDTNFSGIAAIIRNFRNDSGHPSGKIISREQCYILLQLFIPYCKKIYQLRKYYSEEG